MQDLAEKYTKELADSAQHAQEAIITASEAAREALNKAIEIAGLAINSALSEFISEVTAHGLENAVAMERRLKQFEGEKEGEAPAPDLSQEFVIVYPDALDKEWRSIDKENPNEE